eukprot:c5173_g1_i1.p1 GENE.c5173_g1_i1~~c5173_g1_i1.p1  ORF type:complete len:430 (+),score=83.14 c5173_g1_i1:35-1291(+)
MTSKWLVEASIVSQRTSNPIRKVVDQLNIPPNPDLPPISMSIGDPTLFGNLPPPTVLVEELQHLSAEGKSNGYSNSCGFQQSRAAVANSLGPHFTADDVVLASGCSGALDMCITVLANEGDNILIPCPAFSLYQTLADSKGIECRHYNLMADRHWEINLDELAGLVDKRTKAIVINNPSNPCGSVFSLEHLKAICAKAAELQIPIIADEIYAHMTFSDTKFYSILDAECRVPTLIAGGIAKRYNVPGLRLGWVVVHDPVGAFAQVRQGLVNLSTLILGPNTNVQAALPKILAQTPQSYYDESMAVLEKNAKFCYERFSQIPGLTPIQPQGAMYMMVRVDREKFAGAFPDSISFAKDLIREQSVYVLPGSCFGAPDFFRVVVCPPIEKLDIALDRIATFCATRFVGTTKRAHTDGDVTH